MRVLVIGGSYFVGRAIVCHLLEAGAEVAVLNRGTRPVAGARQLVADRDRPATLEAALAGLAFDAVVDTSCYTGAQARDAWAALRGRFGCWLQLGSASVYTESHRFPVPEDAPVGRELQWGDYGEQKLAAEHALGACACADSAPAVVLRAPYIYGPGNDAPRERWLWARMLRGRPILIPNQGATSLQMLHSADLARAVEQAITAPLADLADNAPRPRLLRAGVEAAGGVVTWNVAHPEYHSIRDYVRALGAVAGVEPELCPVPVERLGIAARDFFPFRDLACVLDVERIRAELGWQPGYDFASRMRHTLASYDRDALRTERIDTDAEDAIRARLGPTP